MAKHDGQAQQNGLLERQYGEQANANHEGQAANFEVIADISS